jgi:hypothetical protein
MNQFLICNQDEITSKLKGLTKTGTSVDGWTDYYKVLKIVLETHRKDHKATEMYATFENVKTEYVKWKKHSCYYFGNSFENLIIRQILTTAIMNTLRVSKKVCKDSYNTTHGSDSNHSFNYSYFQRNN